MQAEWLWHRRRAVRRRVRRWCGCCPGTTSRDGEKGGARHGDMAQPLQPAKGQCARGCGRKRVDRHQQDPVGLSERSHPSQRSGQGRAGNSAARRNAVCENHHTEREEHHGQGIVPDAGDIDCKIGDDGQHQACRQGEVRICEDSPGKHPHQGKTQRGDHDQHQAEQIEARGKRLEPKGEIQPIEQIVGHWGMLGLVVIRTQSRLRWIIYTELLVSGLPLVALRFRKLPVVLARGAAPEVNGQMVRNGAQAER